VFKGEDLAWVELSQEWQRAFEAKGWTKPPTLESIGQL
jgi:hypothetical protein